MKRKRLKLALASVLLVWLAGMVYGVAKPLPDGVSTAGPFRPGEVDLLVDLTFQRDTASVVEQEIFDRVFEIIDRAERFVVIDMFLFNTEHGGDREYLPLTETLLRRLVESRETRPDVAITFITDEINTFYGAYPSPEVDALRAAGVDVILTRLTKLRDSNPLFSGFWRPFVQWFGTGGAGLLPHPLTSRGQKVTARSYLRLLNFKANHRKLIVTDRECLVASANPHTASSFHSNIAFHAQGPICADILDGERAVAAFSGGSITAEAAYAAPDSSDVRASYVTEGKIGERVSDAIRSAGAGDQVDVAMFYLADRGVVRALRAADRQGAAVRLVLDPNRDAFGREKGGIPNRQVAHELVDKSDGRIAVRWYDTHGEQFHSKLVIVRSADSVRVLGGSGNLTRRNIRDLNIEADLEVVAPLDSPFAGDVVTFFERIWSNDGGHHTVDYAAYRDPSFFKRLVYRFQEFSGLSSF